MDKFTHCHVHAQYSLLDGHGLIENYVAAAAADGQPALALTDHGTMAGAIEFYAACKHAGIKPLIGSELYVDLQLREQRIPYHLTVLAADEQGYRDLVRANTMAHQQFYYRPRVVLQDLIDGDMMRHWIVLSGCTSSAMSKALLAGDEQRFMLLYGAMARASRGCFVEVMYHPTEVEEFKREQAQLLTAQVDVAYRHGLPLVLTNDCHYVGQAEEQVHQRFVSQVKDRLNGIEFDGEGFYLKTSAEMMEVAQYIGQPSAYENTAMIAAACELHLPEVDTPQWYVPALVEDPEAEIHQRCSEDAHNDNTPPEYAIRYEHEMNVIRTSPPIMNSYLVAADLIEWCKGQGIPAAGRGSMAGSLVSYLLGITTEDPIFHNLLFKRAVNPARLTIPDFDIDVSSRRRKEVLAYLAERYPQSAAIASYSEQGARGATRMVMRVTNHTMQQIGEVTNQLPEHEADADLSPVPEDIREVVRGYLGLYGNMTVHPAGILIAGEDKPLDGLVPMAWVPSSKQAVTQFNMYTLKKLNLFKLDVLGLSTLDALAYLEQVTGVAPPTEYTDDSVFKALTGGFTCQIFQMDGWAARNVIKRLGIKSFEDIVAINSLVRPGAAQFIDAYHAGEPRLMAQYPPLAAVLGYTRGLILYQEQVMEVCEVLANFDDLEQDDIKEAIKYFRADVFAAIEPRFMSGCAANGHDGGDIWNAIKMFAGYAYNKCVSGDTVLEDGRTIRQWYKEGANKQLHSLTPQGDITPNEVVRVYSTGCKRTLLIVWAGGSLRCTPEHKIWTLRGWVCAGDLTVKDHLYAAQGVQTNSGTQRKHQIISDRQAVQRQFTSAGERTQEEILGCQNSGGEIRNSQASDVQPRGQRENFQSQESSSCCQPRTRSGAYEAHTPEASSALAGRPQGHSRTISKRPSIPAEADRVANTKVPRGVDVPELGECGKGQLRPLVPQLVRDFSSRVLGGSVARSREAHSEQCGVLRSSVVRRDGRDGWYGAGWPVLPEEVSGEWGKAIGDNGQGMEWVPIQRIEDGGDFDTYDIEMASPLNSYLANGIVVHNSHAVTYAAIAYKMQWYKVHYPEQFYAATFDDCHPENKVRLILESQVFGCRWQLPDVNLSGYDSRYDPEVGVVVGLGMVKGIGEKVAQAVAAGRPYSGPDDLKERVVRKACNVRHIALLEAVGAFGAAPTSGTELLGFSPELLARDLFQAINIVESTRLGGYVTEQRERTTKKGEEMGFVTLYNGYGEHKAVLFPREWKQYKKLARGVIPLMLSGGWNERGEFVAGSDVSLAV